MFEIQLQGKGTGAGAAVGTLYYLNNDYITSGLASPHIQIDVH